jgi:hypothetical protein
MATLEPQKTISQNSKSGNAFLKNLAGMIVIVTTFCRFFQNKYLTGYDFIELSIGLIISIYLFDGFKKRNLQITEKNESPKKVNFDEVVSAESKKNVDVLPNYNSNFSSSNRLFATAIDYSILLIPSNYLLDFLSPLIGGDLTLIVSVVLIYILLYSYMQYKSWGALNIMFKKKIVQKDGMDMGYLKFVERTLYKIGITLAYSFIIVFIIFPPIQYFDKGLTPVDSATDTMEKPI